jgi:hypothetical protein
VLRDLLKLNWCHGSVTRFQHSAVPSAVTTIEMMIRTNIEAGGSRPVGNDDACALTVHRNTCSDSVPFIPEHVGPAAHQSQCKQRLHDLPAHRGLVPAQPFEDTLIEIEQPLECMAQGP